MKETRNTKSEILNTGLKLFSEKSYHGSSIRDISKEIGKRESSIYNHFRSKEEILREIITNFSVRNFGKIILTDQLINNISKPQKFFLLLAENILEFWDTPNERMFIKILVDSKNVKSLKLEYSLNDYLKDFRSLVEFILSEMIKHKFIRKFDVSILSNEFISPLFIMQLETILGYEGPGDYKEFLNKHVDFFWKAIRK